MDYRKEIQELRRTLTENGYRILERKRDYNDRERAVIARLTRKED